MQTKYCDFIRSYWEEFFNVHSNLKLTIKDIEDEIQKMIKEYFIFIKEGWCFLTQDWGNILENLFHVKWENFYLLEYGV